MKEKARNISRRELLKTGAAVSAGALVTQNNRSFAAGSDKMGIAMIGCGSRGTKDALDFLKSADGLEMVAVADIFQDRIDGSVNKTRKTFPGKVQLI
jgi:uncharacterized protein (DUF1501 family)